MLQGTRQFKLDWLRVVCVSMLACTAFAADPAITPMTVCEVMRDLAANDGKAVAVLGRYSFRSTATWIAEQSCQPPTDEKPTLALVEDKDAPKLPENYVLDAVELHKKLVEIQHRTSLGKFRFGTSDYDRWAVIYGRVTKKSGGSSLMFRGSGTILLLTGQE